MHGHLIEDWVVVKETWCALLSYKEDYSYRPKKYTYANGNSSVCELVDTELTIHQMPLRMTYNLFCACLVDCIDSMIEMSVV